MIFERNLKLRKNRAQRKILCTQHLAEKYFTKKRHHELYIEINVFKVLQ